MHNPHILTSTDHPTFQLGGFQTILKPGFGHWKISGLTGFMVQGHLGWWWSLAGKISPASQIQWYIHPKAQPSMERWTVSSQFSGRGIALFTFSISQFLKLTVNSQLTADY